MNPRGNLRGLIRQTWTGDDCSGCTDVPSVAEILQGSTNQNVSGVSELNSHDADVLAAIEHMEAALSALLGDINDSIITTNSKLDTLANKVDASNVLLGDIKSNTSTTNSKLDTSAGKIDASNSLLTQIEENTR